MSVTYLPSVWMGTNVSTRLLPSKIQPLSAHIKLTENCQAKCISCDYWKTRWQDTIGTERAIELINEIYRYPDADPQARRFATATAASLVFPFAPHLGAEAYEMLTGQRVWEEPWPDADPDMLQAETFELVCQVNGKVRDRVSAPTGAARDELERLCLEARGVQSHLNGLQIAKVIVVPDKLVNVVVR